MRAARSVTSGARERPRIAARLFDRVDLGNRCHLETATYRKVFGLKDIFATLPADVLKAAGEIRPTSNATFRRPLLQIFFDNRGEAENTSFLLDVWLDSGRPR
jgi:hypothetical protein